MDGTRRSSVTSQSSRAPRSSRFRIAGGLDRLLEAYAAHGGLGVAREHVQLHELCLVAHWYREAVAGRGSQPPAFELDRMRALVRRLR